VAKENRSCRTIIFPLREKKFFIARNNRLLVARSHGGKKKGKLNEQNRLIFSNGCFPARSVATRSSYAAPSCAQRVHCNLDGETIILIILIDAALSLAANVFLARALRAVK